MVKTKWRKAKGLRYCVMKSQSAMEYLMTYGWAILIIAVVLGALFQLGVFNSMTFAPKAQPGACQVYRPNGPGSTSFINIEGVCSSELPQYVVSVSAPLSTISLQKSFINNVKSYTISVWIRPTTAESGVIYGLFPGQNCGIFFMSQSSSNLSIGMWNAGYPNSWTYWTSSPSLKSNVWQFVAITLYNGGVGTGTFAAYLDGSTLPGSGIPQETNNTSSEIFTGYIGAGFNNCTSLASPASEFQGNIANLQIYNASLSGPEIQALYQEGIGGAPLRLQNLVGWWPLNGNANDYSGNNNNGNAINVTYTTGWYSGYSAP